VTEAHQKKNSAQIPSIRGTREYSSPDTALEPREETAHAVFGTFGSAKFVGHSLNAPN